MSTIYFTIAGCKHHYGSDFLKRGMIVNLVKEPENKYDSEAIAVKLPGLGTIGYVANSVATRIGESWSAGRIYDRIRKKARGRVRYIMDRGIVCVLLDTKDSEEEDDTDDEFSDELDDLDAEEL